MKTLLILNDAPYGSERTYNGARLAGALARQVDSEVRVLLNGDGAAAAHRQQKVPAGFYNLEMMLGSVVEHSGVVGVCGTCMDARGLGVSGISCVSRLMKSLIDDEAFAELDGELGFGSMPCDGRVLPAFDDVSKRQPDQLGGRLIGREVAFVSHRLAD